MRYIFEVEVIEEMQSIEDTIKEICAVLNDSMGIKSYRWDSNSIKLREVK